MKILVIAPTPFFTDRGTHIRILEEALALERRGHRITIATYHIGRNAQNEVKTSIDIRRIRRLLFWYKKLEAGPDWQKIILDILLIRKTFFLARTQKPDIIHGHLHEGVIIGWIVKKMLFWRKMKLVADFHGSLVREMDSHGYLKGGYLRKIFNWIEKIIDNLGDFAITSSPENSEEISRIRKKNETQTVFDGVNLDYYSKLPEKKELKKEFELPLDKVIITYAGALVFNKGIDYLLESIKLVLKKIGNIYFVIAGFPMEEIEKFVKVNNFENQVRLVSPLNYFDLPKLLGASDIGVDPKDSSTRQASGKILQYMAAGLPVICFDRINNREYLKDAGCYSREISAFGLAQAIINLSNNPDEMKKMAQISRKMAENFSWDKSAQEIEKIYENLYNKKS